MIRIELKRDITPYHYPHHGLVRGAKLVARTEDVMADGLGLQVRTRSYEWITLHFTEFKVLDREYTPEFDWEYSPVAPTEQSVTESVFSNPPCDGNAGLITPSEPAQDAPVSPMGESNMIATSGTLDTNTTTKNRQVIKARRGKPDTAEGELIALGLLPPRQSQVEQAAESSTAVEGLPPTMANQLTASQLRAAEKREGLSQESASRTKIPSTIGAYIEAAAELEVKVGELTRHPLNRRPSPAAVAAMAKSIDQDGQLERVIVRRMSDSAFQILSGETRWLGIQKLKGGKGIVKAKVLDNCDDALALEILALMNAKREDLTAIEKAESIEHLCEPIEKGGAGYSRERAGAVYGVSADEASNLVRLLKLPLGIRLLVSDGKLPHTFARSILPFLEVPRIDAEVIKEVQSERWKESPPTRSTFENFLREMAKKQTRSMSKAQYVERWNVKNCNDVLFKATDEQLVELKIVELPTGWDGKKEKRALNTKLWDELQKPAKQKKMESLNAGADSQGTAKKKGPTPAELTARHRQAVDDWKSLLFRWAIGNHLLNKATFAALSNAFVFRLMLWLLASPDVESYGMSDAWEAVAKRAGFKSSRQSGTNFWESLASKEMPWNESLRRTLAEFIWPAEGEVSHYDLPAETLPAIAQEMGIDLEKAFLAAQQTPRGRELVVQFFELHNAEQLTDLAEELKVNLHGCDTQKDMVPQFVQSSRVLPLPKCLAGKKAAGKKAKKVPA